MAESKDLELKAKQQERWSKSAASYSDYVLDLDLFPAVRLRFLDSLVPLLRGRRAPRALDVASASGEPALSLAQALPRATVVSTDLVEGYQALGRRRAESAGVPNVTFEAADGEDLRQFGDASFDLVTCSLGLMFMPDEAKALREFRRVLRPGGVLAVTVWGERVSMFDMVAEVTSRLDPSAGMGHIELATRFGDGKGLRAAIAAAGFTDVDPTEFDVPFHLSAGGDWWDFVMKAPFSLPVAIAAAKDKGIENAEEEARRLFENSLRARGCIRPDGSVVCAGNLCRYITARASLAA